MREREILENMADAPARAECGALMVRNGACYKCLNFGSVLGVVQIESGFDASRRVAATMVMTVNDVMHAR